MSKVLVLLALLTYASPAFADLPRLYDSEGKSLSLEAAKGVKWRVLVFAGLGLPAETALLDLIQANRRSIRELEDATVLVVFEGMTPMQAGEYCRGREYRFRWACDPPGELLRPLDVDYLPTLVVLDPKDRVAYRSTALPEALLKGILKHPDRPPENSPLAPFK